MTNPDAEEIADDGIDQDCNETDTVTCYRDADNDDYGVAITSLDPDGSCTDDDGQSDNDLDCDDTAGTVHPGATEIPDDGIDQDCDEIDPFTPVTFIFTGSPQMYVVPVGYPTLLITAYGAQGGNGPGGGRGGMATGTISVTPGETIYVFVGGINGYNGGGGSGIGRNGGGASDVRRGGVELTRRVIVAGGGGGGASEGVGNHAGGAGGGPTGGNGEGFYAGGGATQIGPGSGGGGNQPGAAGGLGVGGDTGQFESGGGGGGYYGGGAGGNSADPGDQTSGGGGGSSFVPGGGTTTGDVQLGDGMVVIAPPT